MKGKKYAVRLVYSFLLLFILFAAGTSVINPEKTAHQENAVIDRAKDFLAIVTGTSQEEKKAENFPVAAPPPEAVKKIVPREQFSRVSFFYTGPFLGSLAIPSAWEGKYKTEESENTIEFWYAPAGKTPFPIFDISFLNKDQWDILQAEEKNLEAIGSMDNIFFVLKIYSEEIEDPESAGEYEVMKKDLIKIIESFKIQKKIG